MPGPKKVTFIILSQDKAQDIEKMINGLLHFKKDGHELIIVDDASLDGTSKIIFERLEKTVDKVIYNDRRRGKILSIADASRVAKNDTLVIVEAASLLATEDYEKLASPVLNNQVDAVCGIEEPTHHGSVTPFWSSIFYRFIDVSAGLFTRQKMRGVCSLHKAFNKKVFAKIYESGSKFGADSELMARLLRDKKSVKQVVVVSSKYFPPFSFYDFLMSIYALPRYYFFKV